MSWNFYTQWHLSIVWGWDYAIPDCFSCWIAFHTILQNANLFPLELSLLRNACIGLLHMHITTRAKSFSLCGACRMPCVNRTHNPLWKLPRCGWIRYSVIRASVSRTAHSLVSNTSAHNPEKITSIKNFSFSNIRMMLTDVRETAVQNTHIACSRLATNFRIVFESTLIIWIVFENIFVCATWL